ncbi:hypothetical protein ACJ7V3_11805 [Halomonas elongata]|uniref:hypothetical protein n=1 Tax=Halomonas elongata TaxID=2746 RepID=UPI0038D3BBF2
MAEVPKHGSQLDRIEGLLAQVLDRLTRMEERQNAQSAQIESHAAQIAEQSSRIRELELANAVANANTSALKGRWAAAGAVALVALGAIGGFLSRLVAPGILG